MKKWKSLDWNRGGEIVKKWVKWVVETWKKRGGKVAGISVGWKIHKNVHKIYPGFCTGFCKGFPQVSHKFSP